MTVPAIHTRRIAAGIVAVIVCVPALHMFPAQAQTEVVRGQAVAVDGRVLIINGKQLTLANITVPEMGTECLMRGKLRDCGKFAQLGLTELVVAASIECRRATQMTYSCKTGDGYDLAFGQIHAGWAVPTPTAPKHYFTKMKEAKAKKRMLWSALHPEKQSTLASVLLTRP